MNVDGSAYTVPDNDAPTKVMTGMRISAEKAYFIKLGRGGQWEAQCLRDGVLRFGYREASHDDCLHGRWDKVQDFWMRARDDKGAATRDTNQIRIFYEAPPLTRCS